MKCRRREEIAEGKQKWKEKRIAAIQCCLSVLLIVNRQFLLLLAVFQCIVWQN
jgi:hypothetical protein